MTALTTIMISNNSFVKLGLATTLILIGLVLTININTQNSSAQFTQNINLTGTWKANDGGTYYIRNIGMMFGGLVLVVTMTERHFLTF